MNGHLTLPVFISTFFDLEGSYLGGDNLMIYSF